MNKYHLVKSPVVNKVNDVHEGTWYTWSVVLFLRTLTEMVVLSGSAILSSMSVTPL